MKKNILNQKMHSYVVKQKYEINKTECIYTEI